MIILRFSFYGGLGRAPKYIFLHFEDAKHPGEKVFVEPSRVACCSLKHPTYGNYLNIILDVRFGFHKNTGSGNSKQRVWISTRSISQKSFDHDFAKMIVGEKPQL